jgi:hypothetical protein
MRYVLYNKEAGIYLGSCMGLGFWSKWDPVGQEAAITFPDIQTALNVVSSWDTQLECQPIEVDIKEQYASIADCERAGLPAWDPNRNPE